MDGLKVYFEYKLENFAYFVSYMFLGDKIRNTIIYTDLRVTDNKHLRYIEECIAKKEFVLEVTLINISLLHTF